MASNISETCPYLVGDPVEIQVSGYWARGRVAARVQRDEPGRFGLTWAISVRLPHVLVVVSCDGDGRNHTINHGVRPSFEDEVLDEFEVTNERQAVAS